MIHRSILLLLTVACLLAWGVSWKQPLRYDSDGLDIHATRGAVELIYSSPPSAWEFDVGVALSRWMHSCRVIYVKLWALTAIFAAAFIVSFSLGPVRRWRRQRAGCCVACGYELRASAGVCPECGHDPVARSHPANIGQSVK